MSGHICHYDGGKPMSVLPIHRRRNTLETVVVLSGSVGRCRQNLLCIDFDIKNF